MIQLTRLNHVPLIVNADLIEHVEVTPDTVVALTTGQKFMVLESAEDVVERVIQYRKTVLAGSGCPLKDGRAERDPMQVSGRGRE
ncbi:MAG TPA: flagellar FlbD family protein [Bryobacteraceae bacterium]|nr:flagellar FlbD family protein [Bryobacteraceae bacterium]